MEETNVFTSFAVPPDDIDAATPYLPVPSMKFLQQDLDGRIKVKSSLPLKHATHCSKLLPRQVAEIAPKFFVR